MKHTLWTFDFTMITLGTIISAIGGVAMNFALSLVVFDQTSSTLATGIFAAVSFLPSTLIPLLCAPYVDTHIRKHIIVRLDAVSGLLYLMFSYYLLHHTFSYSVYMIFSLVVGSIGAVYNLAYTSLYPELITKGFMQKGYSISFIIYPSITAIMVPVASFMYVKYGIISICLLEGVLLLCASFGEHFIRYEEQCTKTSTFSFVAYGKEIKKGLDYVKKEKGIKNIYSYMALTNGSGEGISLMTMAMFQSNASLSTTMYGFLSTAEMIGRFCGSIFHYFVKIPYEKRYKMAVSVYVTYEGLDMILLFITYPLMLINRFIAGFLGINSLNIRESSTQNYIPSHMRARVNAFFSVIVAIVTIFTKLIAGVLGEFMEYRYVALCFAMLSMVAIFCIIVRNKKHIEPIYNKDI